MRRPLVILLLLLAVTLAAGCSRGDGAPVEVDLPDPARGVLQTPDGEVRLGTLAIDRQVTVLHGGQVHEVLRIMATDGFADLYRDQTEAVHEATRVGWDVKVSERGGRYTVTLSREYPDFDLFNRDNPGALERSGAPLYDIIRFRGSIAGVTEGYYPAPAGTSPEEYNRFLREAVQFSLRVTLPAKVSSHTMDGADGTSAHWVHAAGDVGAEGVSLVAEARVYKRWPIYAFGGAMLLLVGGAVAIRATRHLWDPDEEEESGGGPPAGGEPPAAGAEEPPKE